MLLESAGGFMVGVTCLQGGAWVGVDAGQMGFLFCLFYLQRRKYGNSNSSFYQIYSWCTQVAKSALISRVSVELVRENMADRCLGLHCN
ncbi:hypothetical protein Bpfe_001996, partial [Biomphalaria pfeifferi]